MSQNEEDTVYKNLYIIHVHILLILIYNYMKYITIKNSYGLAEVVGCLICKSEALSSSPSIIKKN
jgi:hypothetical protein